MGKRKKIAVSSCLLGNNTRYDGKNKHDNILDSSFFKNIDLVAVCPEIEIGLPVPRPPIRLENKIEDPDIINIDTKTNYRTELLDYSTKKVQEFLNQGVTGVILKDKSPSCGISNLQVFKDNKTISSKGVGIFAKVCKNIFKERAVCIKDIHNQKSRNNFLESI